jgi:hypothetical protein
MNEILPLLVSWLVSTTAMFVIVQRDEARLSPEQRARAWPTASRRIAVFYVGILSLPIHFGRTRRTFRGVLLGLAWTLAVLALDEGVTEGVELLQTPAPTMQDP